MPVPVAHPHTIVSILHYILTALNFRIFFSAVICIKAQLLVRILGAFSIIKALVFKRLELVDIHISSDLSCRHFFILYSLSFL